MSQNNKTRYQFPPSTDLKTRITLYCTQNMVEKLNEDLGAGVVKPCDFTSEEFTQGGMPPFFLACINNHVDLVRMLLEHSDKNKETALNINAVDKNAGYSALFFCAMKDQQEMVKLLLDHGADATMKSKFNMGVIDLAQSVLQEKATGVINLIKEYMRNNNKVAEQAAAAAVAAGGGSSDAVAAASAAIKQRTQLMISMPMVLQHIGTGNMHALEQLDDVVTADWLNAEEQVMHSNSLLHMAATMATQAGSTKAMEWLLDKGADINRRANSGATPLHLAASSGSWAAAELLIDRGADLSIKAYDNRTVYAMINARSGTAYKSESTNRKILQKVSNGLISSPAELPRLLHKILTDQSVIQLQLLLDCQIMEKQALSENIGHEWQMPPLHFCVRAGKLVMLEELLRLGVDVNLCDAATNATALHIAIRLAPPAAGTPGADAAPAAVAYERRLDILKVLLAAKNPNLELRDSAAESIVDAAIRSRDVHVIAVVESAWRAYVNSGRASAAVYAAATRSSGGGSNSNLSGSGSSDGGMLGAAAGAGAPSMMMMMMPQQSYMMMMSSSNALELGAEAAAILARFPRTAIYDSSEIELNYSQQLGAGGAGVVVVGTIKTIEKLVACKVVRGQAGEKERIAALKEAELGLKLHSPHIVQTLGVTIVRNSKMGPPDLVIILQLADGTLYSLLTTPAVRLRGGLPAQVVVTWARSIAHGLAALHSKRILFLDAKPHNILVVSPHGTNALQVINSANSAPVTATSAGEQQQQVPPFTNHQVHQLCAVNMLLSDFGISRSLAADDSTSLDVTRSGVGTLRYCSKNQLFNAKLSARDDVYSLGCIFYWLVSGKEPWDGASIAEITTGTLSAKFEPRTFGVAAGLVPSGRTSSAPLAAVAAVSKDVDDSGSTSTSDVQRDVARWDALVKVTQMCLDADEKKRPRNGKEVLRLLLDDTEAMEMRSSQSMSATTSNNTTSDQGQEEQGQQQHADATEHFEVAMDDDDW